MVGIENKYYFIFVPLNTLFFFSILIIMNFQREMIGILQGWSSAQSFYTAKTQLWVNL